MTYYDTIEEDLARAKVILEKGKCIPDDETRFEVAAAMMTHGDGTIYGADTYAAYKLLESFVEEIERLNKQIEQMKLGTSDWLDTAVEAEDDRDEELERLRARVGPIDPGGSDKIDELESCIEHLRHQLAEAQSQLHITTVVSPNEHTGVVAAPCCISGCQYGVVEAENEKLYDVAKRVCHEFGIPWRDPRTGVEYPPPKNPTARLRTE